MFYNYMLCFTITCYALQLHVMLYNYMHTSKKCVTAYIAGYITQLNIAGYITQLNIAPIFSLSYQGR